VWLESPQRATAALVAAAAFWAAQAAAAAAVPPVEISLESAIEALGRDGLRIFYSTDLVRPWMRVQAVPEAADPEAALAEILAPFGLATRPGPNNAVLVVRAPRRVDAAQDGHAPHRVAPARAEAPPVPPLEEIVVLASQYELKRALAASRYALSQRDLEYLPDLGDDGLRAVARLPGTATNGLSALTNMRGGEAAETLVRVDGLRLYDPFHFRDFQSIFSMIDPRIVRSMEVYTGGFPASLGDRMSGAIDVTTLPAEESLYHEIGLSFFNASFLSSGQYGAGRGQWIGSIRRSNLDLLYDRLSDQPERPRYTDAFAKVVHAVNDRLSITANVLRSDDDILLADDIDREEQAQSDHRDFYAWVSLEQALGDQTSGRTLVARSQLDSRRQGTSTKTGVSSGALADSRSFTISTIQSDWSRQLGENLLLHVGGSASALEGRYDYEDDVVFDLLFDIEGAPMETARSRSISVRPEGEQYALFATLRHNWTQRLAAELGLRWDKQTLDAQHDATLGPRLGMRYALSDRTELRASWGRFHQSQGIHELQVSDGVDTFFEPQRAEHVVVGIEHGFDLGVNVRVEAYEKSMRDLRPRFENLLNSMVLLPELKPDRLRVAPSAARARGVEIMVDGGPGPIQWWAAYSWSRSLDEISGTDVLRSWDQTHAMSAGVDWDAPKWNVSAALIHRSGWPTSNVVLDDSGPVPLAVVEERNAERLDFYRSLDIRLTRKIELDASSVAVFLELANVLGRENPCCMEYELGDEEEAGALVLEPLSYLPTIPSIGVLWKF
jgi:outer membrane receptor protein involved in Fe transport